MNFAARVGRSASAVGWPGLERSEAPEGEKHDELSQKTPLHLRLCQRRAPGLPVGPTLFASVPAPATHPSIQRWKSTGA